MKRVKIQSLLLVLVAAIPLGAAAQLNPTVKVLARATSPVPPECEQGLAPQPAQRLTPEERTSVRDTRADMQAPPSTDLRGQLQAAVDAAQIGNRDLFRDALTRAKSLLGSYPPGAERTAATDLVSELDDLDHVWDYQFSSPTGSFFDASSEPFHVASKYPGYEAYVRRQVIVDQNGNKFYPTRETRDYLIGETGDRLSRLTGHKAPPRPSVRGTAIPSAKPAQAQTTGTTETVKPPKPKQTTTQHTTPRHKTTQHTPRPSTHPRARKPVTHEARAVAPAVTTTHAPAVPTPKPSVVSPAKTPAPPRVTTAAATTASTNTVAPPPSLTTPTDTMSSAPSTNTNTMSTSASSDTSATATTPPENKEKPGQSRSFFWPVLLIIVGVGVLVTLWRASS